MADILELSISAAPAQEFSTALAQQNCKIRLYTRGNLFFCDLHVNGDPVRYGAIVQPGLPIIRHVGDAFSGQLYLLDMTSKVWSPYDKIDWQELGNKYKLVYFADEAE